MHLGTGEEAASQRLRWGTFRHVGTPVGVGAAGAIDDHSEEKDKKEGQKIPGTCFGDRVHEHIY